MWIFRVVCENGTKYYQVGYLMNNEFVDIYMMDNAPAAFNFVHYLNGGNGASEGLDMIRAMINYEPLITEIRNGE